MKTKLTANAKFLIFLLILSLIPVDSILSQDNYVFDSPAYHFSSLVKKNSDNREKPSIIPVNKAKQFQLFKSIGIKLGFATNEYGWHHPFPTISQNYLDDPGMGSAWLGAYIEGFSTSYFSAIIDAAYRRSYIKFSYNLYDGNGNIISTGEANNQYTKTVICVSAKVKLSKYYDASELNFYLFGGIRFNMLSSPSFDPQLAGILSGYKTSTTGLNTGIGFTIGKKYRFSADFYCAPDFTDTYTTSQGNFKNMEFGVLLGTGFNNFYKK